MSAFLPPLLRAVQAQGFNVFTSGELNLNIIGIRSALWRANHFDDELHVVYRDGLGWVDRSWPITTDPGAYYLGHPMNSKGTPYLQTGQYRGAYEIGLHKGYEALRQVRPVLVHRYPKDGGTVVPDTGVFGLNIHASDSNPYDDSDRDRGVDGDIGRWSAGCQVFASSADFRAFMSLVVRASGAWGARFSYTLIDAEV